MPQKPRSWVHFAGDWSEPYRAAVEAGARTVGGALAGVMRQENYFLYKSGDSPNRGPRITARGAFLRVFGRITFRQVAAGTIDGWAWTRVAERGEIWVDAVGDPAYLRGGSQNTAHELGHAFAQLTGEQPYNDLNAAQISYTNERGQIIPVAGGGWPNRRYQHTALGYASSRGPWQQHPATMGGGIPSHEDFADMFLGWSYNHFANDFAGAGTARNNWMNANMPRWIALAVAGD